METGNPSENMSAGLEAAARALRIDAQSVLLIERLRASNIDPILIKGVVTLRWLYGGQVTARSRGDVDLLIAAALTPSAETVLADLGFTHDPFDDIPGDKPWHAHAWRDPVSGVEVDLHRTLIGIGVEPDRAWELLVGHTESFDLRGLAVDVLNEPARAMHVALHAAQGGPRDTKAIEDLRRGLQLDRSVWVQARAIASDLDALEAMSAGLRLLPSGADLATELDLPEQVPIHIALRSSSAPPTSIGLAWLVTTPGVLAKIKLIVSKALPPRKFIDVWYPPDRRGRWGLVGAYAYRVKWLMSNLPEAYRAWRRASRTKRG